MFFSFKAYTEEGTLLHSKLEAGSIEEAKEMIKEKGLYCISLSKQIFTFKNPLKNPDTLLFTKQLYQLLKTNIPLLESLKLMQIQSNHNAISQLIFKIRKSIESGHSFHQSLETFPQSFSSFYCKVVEMGEKTRQLPTVFKYLAEDLKQKKELRKKAFSSLLYPLFLLFFCLILSHVALFYLVPSLESLFDGNSSSPITRFLFSLSHHLKRKELYYISGLFLASLLAIKLFKLKKIRQKIDAFSLKIPLLKHYLMTQFFYQFSKSLALLLSSKVSLIEALTLCTDLSSNQRFKTFILNLIQRIQEGLSISESIQNETWIPPIFKTLLAVGEKSGQLAESLQQLSIHFEVQMKDQIKKGMALLSPLLLLMMGLLIGLLTLGILIPLTDFQSFAF